MAQADLASLEKLASQFGFDYFLPPPGRWPKMIHRTTQIDVDILPEAGIPGTPSRPAPVPIGHPKNYQAVAGTLNVVPLNFISLNGLLELKLGAGRAKDNADLKFEVGSLK